MVSQHKALGRQHDDGGAVLKPPHFLTFAERRVARDAARPAVLQVQQYVEKMQMDACHQYCLHRHQRDRLALSHHRESCLLRGLAASQSLAAELAGALRLTLDPRYDMREIQNAARFSLARYDADGNPAVNPHDAAGYFDVGPVDKGVELRRAMDDMLLAMGFHLEASHHEVAIGQHEIDFRHATALQCADMLITFRYVIRSVAAQLGLHATFMPKPI